MADALVGADVDLAFDVLCHFATEITLHPEVLLDGSPDLEDLVLGEVANAGVDRHLGQLTHELGACAPQPVDVCERYLGSLVTWKVHSGDSCHSLIPVAACVVDCSGR